LAATPVATVEIFVLKNTNDNGGEAQGDVDQARVTISDATDDDA
jgi:hypothetical protein